MANTINQVLRRASREVCEVVRIDFAFSQSRGRYAVTFYFPDDPSNGGGMLTYWADWRVLCGFLLRRMRKGGRFATVHRVNMQADHESRNAFWASPFRKKLQARGVQVVCPLA